MQTECIFTSVSRHVLVLLKILSTLNFTAVIFSFKGNSLVKLFGHHDLLIKHFVAQCGWHKLNIFVLYLSYIEFLIRFRSVCHFVNQGKFSWYFVA